MIKRKYQVMEAPYIFGKDFTAEVIGYKDYIVADLHKDLETSPINVDWTEFEEYCLEQRDSGVHDTVDHEGNHRQYEHKPFLQGFIQDNFERLVTDYLNERK